MIELRRDRLEFLFPDVHAEARLTVEFQRTLRIPDDDRAYPLPPGLGCFPLRHVDDFAGRIPGDWLERGGVLLPMYQAEALWLRFQASYLGDRGTGYPFAIKVATGKVDAVTGKPWAEGLHRDPQDYLVAPVQPWLDGYCVEKGIIRQFVAMPLGTGYSAEEQVTGKAEHGGLQIAVYPMKGEAFERRFPRRQHEERMARAMIAEACLAPAPPAAAMGLAPGGRMRQEIYTDPYDLGDWDLARHGRCFVHITNSLTWRAVTGTEPPVRPPTARQYSEAGLPWFDYYDESATPVEGSAILSRLKSLVTLGRAKRASPVPENDPCDPGLVIQYRKGLGKDQVREGAF